MARHRDRGLCLARAGGPPKPAPLASLLRAPVPKPSRTLPRAGAVEANSATTRITVIRGRAIGARSPQWATSRSCWSCLPRELRRSPRANSSEPYLRSGRALGGGTRLLGQRMLSTYRSETFGSPCPAQVFIDGRADFHGAHFPRSRRTLRGLPRLSPCGGGERVGVVEPLCAPALARVPRLARRLRRRQPRFSCRQARRPRDERWSPPPR